jgi:glutamyl-tRNA synthetase
VRENIYSVLDAVIEWVQEALHLRKTLVYGLSGFIFSRTIASEIELDKIVNERRVEGWDDPRMPTIQGVLRRGLTVAALREFLLQQGSSRHFVNLKWAPLWQLNLKYIDSVATLHKAIIKEQCVHCEVCLLHGLHKATKEEHSKNPGPGSNRLVHTKTIIIEQEDAQIVDKSRELWLLGHGTVYATNITKEHGGQITKIHLVLQVNSELKKGMRVIWEVDMRNIIQVEIVTFDYLLTKDVLEPKDAVGKFLTPVTKNSFVAYVDQDVMALRQGDIIKFERKGFYKVDVPYNPAVPSMVLFQIPS